LVQRSLAGTKVPGSGELADRRLAIPESHPGRFHEVVAETGHAIVGYDARFLQEWLGGHACANCFQVPKASFNKLYGAGFVHEGLTSLLDSTIATASNNCDGRTSQLTVSSKNRAAFELGTAQLWSDQKYRAAFLL